MGPHVSCNDYCILRAGPIWSVVVVVVVILFASGEITQRL